MWVTSSPLLEWSMVSKDGSPELLVPSGTLHPNWLETRELLRMIWPKLRKLGITSMMAKPVMKCIKSSYWIKQTSTCKSNKPRACCLIGLVQSVITASSIALLSSAKMPKWRDLVRLSILLQGQKSRNKT